MGLFRRAKAKLTPGALSNEFINDDGNIPKKRSWRRGEQRQERDYRGDDEEQFDQLSDSSIGEALAPGDQFDLYVPIKVRPSKSILRNSGVIGRPHSNRAGPLSHYETKLDESSTASSVTFATLDNSTGAKQSICQDPPSNTPNKTPTVGKRNTTAYQRREPPEPPATPDEMAVNAPASNCHIPWCGQEEEKSRDSLLDGEQNPAVALTDEQKGDKNISAPIATGQQTTQLQTWKHQESTSISDFGQTDSYPPKVLLPSTKNENEVAITPTNARTNNGSSIFPTSFLSGLFCGPRDVADVAIADDEFTDASPRTATSRAGRAFHKYDRSSVSSEFIRRDASLFDKSLTDEDATKRQGTQRRHRQHYFRRQYSSGDRDSVPTYDDEGQTAIAIVVQMDDSRDSYENGDDAVESVDDEYDYTDDYIHVRDIRHVEGDDGTRGWKLRLPRVRSIPKIGKLARPRSFQRSSSRGRSISRGRGSTLETPTSAAVPSRELSTNPPRRRGRSRSRSRSRGRANSSAKPAPSKTSQKGRKNKLSTGREIDPMHLF